MKLLNKLQSDQSGIAHLALILVITAAIATAGFIGYNVWQKNSSQAQSARVKGKGISCSVSVSPRPRINATATYTFKIKNNGKVSLKMEAALQSDTGRGGKGMGYKTVQVKPKKTAKVSIKAKTPASHAGYPTKDVRAFVYYTGKYSGTACTKIFKV